MVLLILIATDVKNIYLNIMEEEIYDNTDEMDLINELHSFNFEDV
jgi:hypothetical protein